jgi:hypothetical protein
MGLFQLCVLPFPPRQRGNISSVYLATSFVQRECIWLPSCARIEVPSKKCVAFTWQVSRFAWLRMGELRGSTPQAVSWSSQTLAADLFLQFSGLHYCCKVADTLRQREICAGMHQSKVLCLHMLWQVQVLPDACRSLLFSVLCIVF